MSKKNPASHFKTSPSQTQKGINITSSITQTGKTNSPGIQPVFPGITAAFPENMDKGVRNGKLEKQNPGNISDGQVEEREARIRMRRNRRRRRRAAGAVFPGGTTRRGYGSEAGPTHTHRRRPGKCFLCSLSIVLGKNVSSYSSKE